MVTLAQFYVGIVYRYMHDVVMLNYIFILLR